MVKVRIVKFNGQSTTYEVEFPKAYIAKIIENQEKIKSGIWVDGDTEISIKEIYANEKLIAEFDGSELRLVKEKPKPKLDKEENMWVMDHTGGNIEITYS